jgi:hypothetical protein
MGLQLSVLVACIGGLELVACLTHVVVCVLKLTDQSSNCSIRYFHPNGIRSNIIITDELNLEHDPKEARNEMESIIGDAKSESDILRISPPFIDGYVRIPTPIPFDLVDEISDNKSSSNPSSFVESGNENPTRRKMQENLSVMIKRYSGSSSDISSIEDIEDSTRLACKRIFKRSRTPELRRDSYDCYDDGETEDVDLERNYYRLSKIASGLSNRKSLRLKAKGAELRRSAENLPTFNRSKRHRELERCKSDMQIQVVRNIMHDDWTNTLPASNDDNLSKASSKRSISVLVQTTFDDDNCFKLSESNNTDNLNKEGKLKACTDCCCRCSCKAYEKAKVRRTTQDDSSEVKSQLLKISSFEEASEDDYEKLATGGRQKQLAWKKDIANAEEKNVKSPNDSESYDDEYIDANEGLPFSEQPIQYSVPESGENQSFWVTSMPLINIHTSLFP